MPASTLARRGAVALATFGYVGFAPVAPGTVGSAAALIVFLPVRLLLAAPPWAELLIALALSAAGVWSATVAAQALGTEDPGPVVIDEVAGMLVSLLWLPFSWPLVVAAFVAFRVFDVLKPWPANRLEHLHGGVGIVADDLMAGVYANLLLQFVIWWRPGLL